MSDSPHKSVAEQVIEGLASGVIALDAKGAVLHANAAAARHLNLPPTALAEGAHLGTIEVLRPLSDAIRKVAERHEGVSRQEIAIKPNPNEVRELGVSISLLEGPLDYNGVILLFTDMTQRRKLERAASVNRHLTALSELAAGVVHQLRNPLTIILGRAELVARKLEKDTKAYDSLQAIREETLRMEDSISQFLAFSKPFTIQPTHSSASAIAKRAIELNQRDAEEKEIEIALHIATGLAEMWVDPMRIAEALSNMVDNALDELGKGGRIEVHAWQDGPKTFFEVRDDGPGIHLNEGEDLLSPFLTKKHDGTGLGLSVAQRIVSAQHGEITYGNRDQGGAWFRIAVPTQQQAAYED